jgi:hypothetical protein
MGLLHENIYDSLLKVAYNWSQTHLHGHHINSIISGNK